MLKHTPYIIFLLLFLFTKTSFSQQYQFNNFSVGDGLAQSQVYSILEDSKGYIWMGTRGGGISQFDGMSFKTFTTKEGLSGNYIWKIMEDKKKRIWVGTGQGISLFQNESFRTIPILKKTKTSVTHILERISGEILISSGTQLFTLKDSIFVPYSIPKLKFIGNITSLYENQKGTLWIGTDNGIYLYDGKDLQSINSKSGLRNNLIRYTAGDKKGNVWIGTYGMGVAFWNQKSISYPSYLEKLNKEIISSILIDKNQTIWFTTTESGIYKLNLSDSTLTHLSEKEGLSNNHVKTIIQDSWGNYWIGTSGGGISKYTGQQFEYFSKKNGFRGSYVYSIHCDYQNRLWVSTSGPGLSVIDSGNIKTFSTDSALSNIKVKSILQSTNNDTWFGTDRNGLFYWSDSTLNNMTTSEGLGGNWIRSIKEDEKGNIWVGTIDGGITRISKTSPIIVSNQDFFEEDSLVSTPYDTLDFIFNLKKIKTGSGLKSNRINQLHIDAFGRCWFATPVNGIGCIDSNLKVNYWSVDDGLSSNNIRSICEDNSGHLWVGTAGKGLDKLHIYKDSLLVEHHTSGKELSSDNIYQLTFDHNDNLWVGSEKGVDKLSLSKEGNVLEYTHYDKNDGFVGVETTLNSTTVDQDGNVWFGTINGLSKYISGSKFETSVPPLLSFTDISFNNSSLDSKNYLKTVELAHDSNMFSIEFIGINHIHPQKTQYQWRLKGIEDNWTLPSKRNSVTYSNLSPGFYSFEVKAINGSNLPSGIQTFSFNITPPYWDELWFKFSIAGLMVLIISTIIMIRFNILKKRTALEHQKITIEKELLQLEQKALRLQMNPHFIFNALNTIQALVSSNDSKTARYYLAKFSKLMRQILDNSRQSSISLEREIIMLDNYLNIEKFCHNDKFEYTIKVDDNIESELIQIPPMLLQPFIENAIIHGVSQKEEHGQIDVFFTLENSSLICCVRDNGIGRAKASKLKSQKDQQHKSTALLVTQERLDILNEEQNNGESILIEDLLDDDKNPLGTLVSIRIST